MYNGENMKVYFVGSGPGDPELITLKAKRILEKADVVVYASSLVDDRILSFIRPEADVYTSAPLTFREIVELLRREAEKGRVVVRLHSGDASIYGAMGEQIAELEKHSIECEVVPGVSSFLAAAALLKKEYTVPGVSQTVIISRISGRTDVPERERLSLLAEHGASMVIFLSIAKIDEVIDELRHGYNIDTPVAVVYRATREGEEVILGNLGDICEKVREKGIKKTALILVGNFLRETENSKLYSENFSHSYRKL